MPRRSNLTEPVAARSSWALLVLVAAGILLVAAPAAVSAEGRGVVLPQNLEGIDPAVRKLVVDLAAEAEADPRSAAAHGRLGLAYEANLLWEEARRCFLVAAELAPEDRLWRFHLAVSSREAGDVEGALEQMRALAREQPGFAPLDQRLGQALLETGDLDGAEAAFGRVIAQEPGAAEGYTGLGEVLLRRGRAEEAVTQLERAVALAPGYRMAHYLLGRAYRALGRLEEARREMAVGVDAGIRYLPDPLADEVDSYAVNLTARIDRAGSYLSSGRAREAAQILEETLVFHPDNVTVLNNLAIAYLHLGDHQAAFASLTRALEIDDRKFSTFINLASWSHRVGRPEDALRYSEEAVARGPGVARTHATRAGALARLGRYPEAVASLETALSLDARDPQIRMALAGLHARAGRLQMAAELYREIADLWPALLPAQLMLCEVNLGLGRFGAAREALAAARRLDPDHPAVDRLGRRLESADPGD